LRSGEGRARLSEEARPHGVGGGFGSEMARIDEMEQRAKRPVLVTGAAGFIGSRLRARLEEKGWDVQGMDLVGGPGVDRIGDVRDVALVERLVPEGGIVFHLASVVGIVEVLKRPRETYRTSIEGTRNLVREALRKGARLVFTSSSEVYGDGRGRRIREEDPLPEDHGAWPRASYPEGKLRAEELCRTLVLKGGDARIARLFNVGGPGQDWRRGPVLPTFVRYALLGEPLPVIGEGGDVRCFQHVEDAVSGLLRLGLREEGQGLVVNLGGEEATTIAALAERTGRVLGLPVRIRKVTATQRYGGPSRPCTYRVPDLERARAILGHRPVFGLDRILRDLAESLRRDAVSGEAVGGA